MTGGAERGTVVGVMSDYETERRQHLYYATALAPRLIERLEWSADRLAAYRSQPLRELARHAAERSPWHHDRLAALDLDRLDEAVLRDLEPMTKSDLMESFDRIVSDERFSLDLVNAHLATVTTGSYLPDGHTAITSGGSTGERGVFVYDWVGWATFWVSVFRQLLRAKWSTPRTEARPIVLGWVAAAHFTHATAALSRTFNSPEFVNFRFPVTLPTEQMVAGLNDARPDVLIAYPSALHVLSFEARAGRLRIAPRQILSCSEPLLPEIRRAAEVAWQVPVGNVWGTSEGGGVAIPCEHARSHLSEDLVIVEPVDEAGRAG
jgi:phenylacetate-coenzyme A ligase PaaK-like adenylate-forming protein